MKKIEYSLENIDSVAKECIQDFAGKQIVTLVGGLGAGKTTFVQAVLRQLGVQGPIASPTFTYFNQYQANDGRMIYHFDLYRLKNLAEFEMAGFFEYLYQPESIVFIEWPEIIDSALLGDVFRLRLAVVGEQKRYLEYI